MGFYINPTNISKEKWLLDNAAIRSKDDGRLCFLDPERKSYPIVWVDNGPFTAAGIAYCIEEYEVFILPDPRPKAVYIATREAIIAVCPSVEKALR
jgi:hypothetical protein